ncbi:MAG: flagellar basal body P-ring formation protein FlgA [Verrucomicrobia bacterium]|nr:flagellar basal body P-ring formation protein FlgA [Verrucomicrobiota bacterium]
MTRSLFTSLTVLLLAIGGGFGSRARATEPSALLLRASAQVDSEGVFLNHLVAAASNAPLPALRLTNAPLFGQVLTLSRAQVAGWIAQLAPEWATTNFTGPASIRITRRARAFAESDLLTLLTQTLQRDHVKDRGELELRLVRPWTALSLPDEPITMRLLDLPTAGVSPMFIVRFELRAGNELLGAWQSAAQARVFREVLVARVTLKRGDTMREDDFARERRDLLAMRDPVFEMPGGEFAYEMADGLQAGAPAALRSFRLKPLLHRGQSADALVQDGALSVTMKVEVLEDGAPGQLVRARNPQSKREVRGKVLNEQTLLIPL